LTEEGLPVGLQIIGPEDEDPTTIEFARLLAAEIVGFGFAKRSGPSVPVRLRGS
jgi:Asp-tRNA(Asn)/Glu-tRNA(Gln) amidotransferase A subunit family amidase